MLLTKTQRKILEIVREYGGMKAEMLKRLCPEAYSFEVALHQLEVNRRLTKAGEYLCDDTGIICDRNTETAFDIMLAVCAEPPEVYCRGRPPFSLTFFKEREQKLCRYDICVVTDGREQVINAMLAVLGGKYGTVIFVLEEMQQAERLTVPPDCRFAVKENTKYTFYGGN